MSYKILITDYVWPNIEPEKKVLSSIDAEIIVAPNSDENTLCSLAKDVDGILTCFAQVTEKVIRSAKKCVVIGRYGVGVDNISVSTATDLGIAVTYVPDYCMEEVSDHVIGLMLCWNRKIAFFDSDTKQNAWGHSPLTMRIMRLKGKTIGIVGFGRIGKAVSQKAKSFGMNILTYDPFVSQTEAASFGVNSTSLENLLQCSDFVSLHSPYTEETHNMIGQEQLDLMKSDSFLINCARGPLIDEEALFEALKSKNIAGAGLDVMVDSIPPSNHPLMKLDNILITPHISFISQESVLELEERAAEEVKSVLLGQMPENLVNKEVLKHSLPRHKLSK